MWLSTALFVPISVFTYYSEELFRAIGQNPEIAPLSSMFAKICLPGMWLSSYGYCYSRYFYMNQNLIPDITSKLLATFVHSILSYHLAVTCGMRNKGVAISTSTQFAIRYLVMQVFYLCEPTKDSERVSVLDY